MFKSIPFRPDSQDEANVTISKLLPEESLATQAWNYLKDNVAKPAYNSGIVHTVNTLADGVNVVSTLVSGKTLTGHLQPYEMQQSKEWSIDWAVQHVVSGFAGSVPYAVCGKIAAFGLRGLGTKLVTGGAITNGGLTAKVLTSDMVANVAGAAIFDGMRAPLQNESRKGNALGGVAGFAVFELGNGVAKSLNLLGRIGTRAITGAAGADLQLRTSRYIATGQGPSAEELHQARVSGAFTNVSLPVVHEGLALVADHSHLAKGQGMPLARFAEQNGLKGTNPVLDKLIADNPLARVQPGHSHNQAKADKLLVHIKEANGAKLGHELNHLTEAHSPTARSKHKEVLNLLREGKDEAAWEIYKTERERQEKSSRAVEHAIKNVNSNEDSPVTKGTNIDVAALKTPADTTYEQSWRADFELVRKSQGKHITQTDYADEVSQRPGRSKADDIKHQVEHAFAIGEIERAQKLLSSLSEAELKTEAVCNAVKSIIEGQIAIGWIDNAKAVLNLKLLNESQAREAISSGLSSALSDWRVKPNRIKEVLGLKLLQESDLKAESIRNAARLGLTMRLEDDPINLIKERLDLKLLSESDLKAEAIRNAVSSRLAKELARGDIKEAKTTLDLKLLTGSDLKAAIIRNAAGSGLVQCLLAGKTRSAKEVLDLKLLDQSDLKAEIIRNAASSELNRHLFLGQLAHAKAVLDLKLLSPSDLKAAGIHNVAQIMLARFLSQGQVNSAKIVLDLSLLHGTDLKTEAIRNAASSGLVNLLSRGLLYKARKILDLKLLNESDFKMEAIRNAASSRLEMSLKYEWNYNSQDVLDLKVLDSQTIDNCFNRSVKDGNITAVLRAALANRMDLNAALKKYVDIPTLTDEHAAKLVKTLKQRDPSWRDQDNVQKPFDKGAEVFGPARMLRYMIKRPHDALTHFDDILYLYKQSGLNKDQFYGNILSQVSRDSAITNTGSSFSRLNAIARSFPADCDSVLQNAKNYPEIKTLTELVATFPSQQSIFASWSTLQRFSKLQQALAITELLPELKLLRQNQEKLADWVESLAFHPDSNISLKAVKDFWKSPEEFLDYTDAHSSPAHELKKPSNYTNIPHLDLTARALRNALIDGTLDRLQVFEPMKIEYEVGGSEANVTKEIIRALGSRQEGRAGEAKNVGKLFNEINKLLQGKQLSIAQLTAGAEIPAELRQQLETVLYHPTFGVDSPPTGMRLIAEIHQKSDPLAVVAGDDTASCMSFGTGKNNVYMFNPNDALFTVRLVRNDGTTRTIAQSVLTKDKDVKTLVPDILQKIQADGKIALYDIIPEEALREDKAILAADNVEVHPNYRSGIYPEALEAVYRDFFSRYSELPGVYQSVRDDKMVIGLGYSETMNRLPKEPNTFVPQAPPAYSDKTHSQVYSLLLNETSSQPLKVLKIEQPSIAGRPKSSTSNGSGITPLTFEDTLPLAYLEGKVFKDNPSLSEGLHNMENALIAKDINNTAKNRPNLSLKYADKEGRMKGYLLAYEGHAELNGTKEPIIFISDYTSDRQLASGDTAGASMVGGKLLLEFGKLYKEHYLDKGKPTPIFTNAREGTAYRILMRQVTALSKKLGCRLEVKEIGTHQVGSSTMHDVLIIPQAQ